MKPSKLSLFDFSVVMISLVIGMGIFRTPVNVAKVSPNEWIFYLSWIAGGIVALSGALTYAEIGSRFPVTGAYYKIFSHVYHPSLAFGVNCIILVSNASSVSGVALIGSEYLVKVIDSSQSHPIWQVLIAVTSILLFYGVNLLGLKLSARTQNILMIIKISMIILLISPLFFCHPAPASQTIMQNNTSFIEYIKAFGIGLIAVSFTYGGYQQSINFGAEVNNPSRNIPRGILLGISIIILLYLLVNYAYVHVIGFQQLKSATGIAAIMASNVFGDAAANILSVVLFLSVLAYVNVLLMSNPRVMAAMSEDGVLPPAFAKRNNKSAVLVTALSVFAAMSILVVFWAESFDEILSFAIFLDCFGMVLSAATIFFLRRHANVDDTEIYKMKLYPLFPVIFIAAYTFVGISIFIDKPSTAITGLVILLLFILLYFILRQLNRKAF